MKKMKKKKINKISNFEKLSWILGNAFLQHG